MNVQKISKREHDLKRELLNDLARAFREAPKAHKRQYLAYAFYDRSAILVCKN